NRFAASSGVALGSGHALRSVAASARAGPTVMRVLLLVGRGLAKVGATGRAARCTRPADTRVLLLAGVAPDLSRLLASCIGVRPGVSGLIDPVADRQDLITVRQIETQRRNRHRTLRHGVKIRAGCIVGNLAR